MFVDFGFKSPIAALESLKTVLKTDDRFDASQKYLDSQLARLTITTNQAAVTAPAPR